jgi:hypothetical protein
VVATAEEAPPRVLPARAEVKAAAEAVVAVVVAAAAVVVVATLVSPSPINFSRPAEEQDSESI